MGSTLVFIQCLLLSSAAVLVRADTSEAQHNNASDTLLQDKLLDSHWKSKYALSRIVGGTNVQRNQFSYFTSAVTQGICGATLIGPQTVLSAAHCFDNPIFPYVGKTLFINAPRMEQGIQRTITELVLHPNYKQGSDLNYDFALLQLDSPVTVPNPPNLILNTDPAFPASFDTATAIGHGASGTGEDVTIVTKFVDVTIRPSSTCSNVYGTKAIVPETMICAENVENEGICQGDSGGPIVVRNGNDHVLVGVTSFSGPTCGQFPEGYARVSAAIPWIQRIACPWESQNFASFCDGVALPPSPAPTSAAPTRSPKPTTSKSGDSCGEAIDLGTLNSGFSDIIFGSTVGASTEPNLSPCNVGDAPAVWYKFKPSTDMEVTTSLCGSTYDTKLAILLASTCSTSNLICINNDDAENQCGEAISLQSYLDFEVLAGNTYYIIVSGFDTDAGDYDLAITTTGGVPPNNVCSLATDLGTVSLGAAGQATGTTKYANSEPGLQTCGLEPNVPAVWNTFQVDEDAWVTVSLCGSDPSFDTTLLVLSAASECSSLACVAFNDDFCSLQSSLKFFASGGVTYYAVVSGFDVTSFGEYEITVSKATDGMGTCVDATDLGTVGENISRQVTGNTNLAAATSTAGCEIDDIPSVFYTFTAKDAFEAELSLCGSNYDTSVSVFYGTDCGNLQCLGNNDDSSLCSSLGSHMTFVTEPNVRYYIAVSGSKFADPGTDTGDFELSLSKSTDVRPSTTGCEDANDFGLFDFETTFLTSTGTTAFADRMPADFGCGLLQVRSRWYAFRVETMAEITASLCNSDFDTWMSVLVGDRCEGLACVGHNDNECGINSVMSFLAVPGQTYFVVVSGYSAADVGDYELRVDGQAVTRRIDGNPAVSPAPTISEAPTSERVPTSNPPPSGPSSGTMAVSLTSLLLAAIMGTCVFAL